MKYYREINGETVFFQGNVLYTDEMTIINPSTEMMIQAGWQVWVPTEEDALNTAKRDKIIEIENYDDSDEVNTFYLSDQALWLDAQTRQQLRISIEAYKAQNVENVTKWFNGQQYIFPTDLWLNMLNALEVYAGESLNVTEAHKANVMALQSIEAVKSYDYTTGYPSVLHFTL